MQKMRAVNSSRDRGYSGSFALIGPVEFCFSVVRVTGENE